MLASKNPALWSVCEIIQVWVAYTGQGMCESEHPCAFRFFVTNAVDSQVLNHAALYFSVRVVRRPNADTVDGRS